MQIDLTWNLFTTPVVVAISTLLLARWLNNRDTKREEKGKKVALEKETKDQEIAQLLAQLEAEKEKASAAWRKTQTDTLCKVKSVLEEHLDRLSGKVDKDDCEKVHKATWDAIRDIRNRT
jgi:predicted transcriptional regulator